MSQNSHSQTVCSARQSCLCTSYYGHEPWQKQPVALCVRLLTSLIRSNSQWGSASLNHIVQVIWLIKAIGTKEPFNGGLAVAWISTVLCVRLQLWDLFISRTAINHPNPKLACGTRCSQSSQVFAWKSPVNHLNHWCEKLCESLALQIFDLYNKIHAR